MCSGHGSLRPLTQSVFRTRVGVWTALHVANRIDKRLMRWSKGSLNVTSGSGFADSSMLLRCTGAQSGKARDVPVFAFEYDDGWVLIASAGGQERNPAWYHNLKAHPRCALLVPRHGEVSCIAHEAEGEERGRAWEAANTGYSGYAVYQQRTQRSIPVMVLRPENNFRIGAQHDSHSSSATTVDDAWSSAKAQGAAPVYLVFARCRRFISSPPQTFCG